MGRARKGRPGAWFARTEIALWVLVAGSAAVRVLPAEAVGTVAEDGGAPVFSVRALDGDRVDLADLRGQVVLVNFWATWCPPCRLEMPGFQSVYERYRDQGFTVVGLSADAGGPDAVEAFVRANGITYPVAMATREIQRAWGGVDMLPQSFLLDREGRVRKRVSGVFSEATLSKSVKALLAEEVDR